MYGPPGTGKTLMARACAAQTKSTFLKLAGPQLVQMFIGDGAKLVRDAFALAKEKAPAIIFIDELDAIGIVISLFLFLIYLVITEIVSLISINDVVYQYIVFLLGGKAIKIKEKVK